MTRPVNSTPPSLKYDVHWVKPVKCGIKINCDATVDVNVFVVAQIAGDWRGKVVFVFGLKSKYQYTSPS